MNDKDEHSSGDERPVWQAARLPRLQRFQGETAPGATDAFIQEVRRIKRNFHLRKGEAVEWVLQALEGAARQEILSRPEEEISTVEKILGVLEETFGDHRGIATLLSSFYGRRQGRLEPVLDYAQCLQQLANQISGKGPSSIPPHSLRDRFVEGLYIPALRRDIRRYVRETAAVTFSMARAEALRWMREDYDAEEAGTVHLEQINSGKQPDQLAELTRKVDMLLQEKAERDQETANLRDENKRLRTEIQAASQWDHSSRGAPRFSGACFYCKKGGHKKAECRKRLRDQQQAQLQTNQTTDRENY